MSTKQEQQQASTAVEEVAPGILRMQLPIAMPGLRHVNTYCLPDEHGAALIDPGLPDEASWAALQERLKSADLQLRHIHTVLVTHSHPDHFGGAARLHQASGARVIVHEHFSLFGERPELAHSEVSVEHLTPLPVVVKEPAPIPDSIHIPWGGERPGNQDPDHRQWERIRNASSSTIIPPVTHVVRHGDVLQLGRRPFTIVHSPGHTSDHICFYDRDAGTLIAGDHVLPSITPHISGLNQLADPLQAFFESLDRMLELGDVRQCLPAHGHPFVDLPGRIEAIKRHHRERLDKLVAIGREFGKPAQVRDYARALFSERAWGIMAESETYAHLEYLRLRGRADSHRRADGELLYVA